MSISIIDDYNRVKEQQEKDNRIYETIGKLTQKITELTERLDKQEEKLRNLLCQEK